MGGGLPYKSDGDARRLALRCKLQIFRRVSLSRLYGRSPGNKVRTHFCKLWSSLSFRVGLCPGFFVIEMKTRSVTNSHARTSSSSGKNTRGYQYVFGKSLLCYSMAVSGSSASISVLFLQGFNSLKKSAVLKKLFDTAFQMS